MTLLHWALLPLAGLAVVPLLLHLLTLQRLRTVELSTYRFLFDSYVQQRRRMKFLEALLALLRSLFLLALVLVFCRPVVKHWDRLFGGVAGREVVFLVDTSASMNARTAGQSSLDRARAAVLAVAKGLGRDDRLTLIRVGARPVEVFSRYGTDAEAIRERVEALQPGPARANLFAALSHVFRQPDARPSVYLFTDGQSSAWREMGEGGVERVVPEGATLTVVNVGTDESLANRGVVGDTPSQKQAILGLPVRLRPRVVNPSKTETAEVTVGVFLDEKEVARVPFTLKPGETAAKEVVYAPSEAGTLKGRFEIPPDRFPDDDSFLFTLNVARQVKVLLVNGRPSADPFEDGALYLRTALSATSEGDRPKVKPAVAALGPSPEFVRSLDVQEVTEDRLTTDALYDASVVILADCGGLGEKKCAALREFVASGGGLLIFPGEKVHPDVYNTQFFPVPGPQNETLIAAELGSPTGDPAQRATFERLASIDFTHPALSVFDDPDAHYLTTAHIARRFPLKLNEPQGSSWPLAKFASGTPALVESRLGDGVVVLAAFPADTRWSNLPLKPEFVPLILRLVSYATHAPDLQVPSTAPADSPVEIAVAGTWAPATGQVNDTQGRPSPLTFERSASRLLSPFEDTDAKGYYAVEVKGGRTEPPQVAMSAFAVNVDPEESRFEAVTEKQLREWLPGTNLNVVNASAEQQQIHGSLDEKREVWRPLILVLFGVVGIEFMLATPTAKREED